MAALIGVSDPPDTIDAMLLAQSKVNIKIPVKAPIVRTYATMDNPAPSYWTGLNVGRAELFTSLKLKLGGKMIPLQQVIDGQFDNQIIRYIQFLISLQRDAGCFDHELDAATAAQGGTVQQLNDAVLHCNRVARNVPGWDGELYTCITGWAVQQREPLYLAALNDSDKIAIDPYPTGTNSVDSAARPVVQFLTARFPGKRLLITEWGVPTGNPNQAQEITNFTHLLATDPVYSVLDAALYWAGGGFGISGASAQALAYAIASSYVVAPPVDQLKAAQAALAAEVAKNAALLAQVNAANLKNGQLTTAMKNAETALLAATG